MAPAPNDLLIPCRHALASPLLGSRRRLVASIVSVAMIAASCSDDRPSASPTSTPDERTSTAPTVDIRADVTRDGTIDARDDETAEGKSGGAIVLPNIDDDAERCRSLEVENSRGEPVEDEAFIRCSDAVDDVVNGPADELDLTPLTILPVTGISDAAAARVSINGAPEGSFRVFVVEDTAWSPLDGPLSADQLRDGVDLMIEATDIRRDAGVWNGWGVVAVTLVDGDTSSVDELPLRVAPVVLQGETTDVEQLIIAPTSDSKSGETQRQVDVGQRFERDVRTSASAIGADLITLPNTSSDVWVQDQFEPAFVSRPTASGAHTMRVLIRSTNLEMPIPEEDPETQAIGAALERLVATLDQAERERIFTSGPDAIVAWIAERDPQLAARIEQSGMLDDVQDTERSATGTGLETQGDLQLRRAGAALYSELRGRDVAVVQIDAADLMEKKGPEDTYNSTGNLTTTPPDNTPGARFPDGRVIYGTGLHPLTRTLLAAQSAAAPLELDTSWLIVGHIDEFLSFVPAENERGWKVLVADPGAALDLLQRARADGHGSALLLDGVTDVDRAAVADSAVVITGSTMFPRRSLARTVSQVLDDPDVARVNEAAIAAIDANIEILEEEFGLGPDDIVRVPVLYDRDRTFDGLDVVTLVGDGSTTEEAPTAQEEATAQEEPTRGTALLPNAVNGVYLGSENGRHVYLSPSQAGPRIDGVDIVEQAVSAALSQADLETRFVDITEYAHLGLGALHCVTNAFRSLPV